MRAIKIQKEKEKEKKQNLKQHQEEKKPGTSTTNTNNINKENIEKKKKINIICSQKVGNKETRRDVVQQVATKVLNIYLLYKIYIYIYHMNVHTTHHRYTSCGRVCSYFLSTLFSVHECVHDWVQYGNCRPQKLNP